MPIPTNEPPKPPIKELGDSGKARGGIIAQRDYNYKLVGSNAIKLYDEMRLGDATVKATLQAINLPLLRAKWRIQPASETRQDRRIAEFVEDAIWDEPTKTWQETLNEILLFLPYGRMPFEKLWEYRPDGMIGLHKLSSLWPDTISKWEMANGGNGVLQETTNGSFSIPIEKMIVFINQKEGENWEGVSILRSAYKHWYMKDKFYLIDAIAAERQGLGVPYAKVPSGTIASDESKIEEILQNFRANEKGYLYYEEGWDVGLAS